MKQRRRAAQRARRRVEMRDVVFMRALGRCERCGAAAGWDHGHLQHRRAGGMGGTALPDQETAPNGVWACAYCHLEVMEKRLDGTIEQGWVVPHFLDPASVAIKHHERGWVLLTPEGGYEPCG